MTVDLSDGVAAALTFIVQAFTNIINLLDSIYIFSHVSVLSFFIAVLVLSLIISAIFVLFDGGVDDD